MKKPGIQLSLLGALLACAASASPVLAETKSAAPVFRPLTEAEASPQAAPAPAATTETAPAPQAEAAPEPASPAAEPESQAETADVSANEPSDWLEAVRAQRKAREEARAARRAESPWGHEDIDAYREQMRQRTEQYREAMRARRRWVNPRGEYIRDLQEARRNAMQAQAEAMRKQFEKSYQRSDDWMSPAPYGWNNPWYYQGY